MISNVPKPDSPIRKVEPKGMIDRRVLFIETVGARTMNKARIKARMIPPMKSLIAKLIRGNSCFKLVL